jgi:hypothetical protein
MAVTSGRLKMTVNGQGVVTLTSRPVLWVVGKSEHTLLARIETGPIIEDAADGEDRAAQLTAALFDLYAEALGCPPLAEAKVERLDPTPAGGA